MVQSYGVWKSKGISVENCGTSCRQKPLLIRRLQPQRPGSATGRSWWRMCAKNEARSGNCAVGWLTLPTAQFSLSFLWGSYQGNKDWSLIISVVAHIFMSATLKNWIRFEMAELLIDLLEDQPILGLTFWVIPILHGVNPFCTKIQVFLF